MHQVLTGWDALPEIIERVYGHGNAQYQGHLPAGYQPAERNLQLIRLCEYPPEDLAHVLHFIGFRNNVDKAVFFKVGHDRVV